MTNAPSINAHSFIVSSINGLRILRSSARYPLNGFITNCSIYGVIFSKSPSTKIVPTGFPSRPSAASSVAIPIARSSTSGRTCAGTNELPRFTIMEGNSCAASITIIESNLLLPSPPPRQQTRSVGLILPRISPTNNAARNCDMR